MLQINKNTVIKRAAYSTILDRLQPGKVVVVYGPRRTGKTTLLEQIRSDLNNKEKIKSVTGENVAVHKPLSSRRLEDLTQFVGEATLLIIDEAQLIPDIGRNLKLLVDSYPQLKILTSGSATFDLAQKVGEPLVGRKWTVWLYPFWFQELAWHASRFDADESLDTLLVFGSYPETAQAVGYEEKEQVLTEMADSYLYKDVLALESVRRPKIVRQLLELLAHQVGQEVSLTELGNTLDVDKETVARYLDMLEQAFVLINIRGFSRNLRKEVTKTSRYYFYDTGIRNALIGNFNRLDRRTDTGALWENWLVMERLKKQKYTSLRANNYFWRTYDQKEIDWVEERGGRLFGYEFSWQEKNIRQATRRAFLNAYPESKLSVVHRGNYDGFVSSS